jgi:hypothetical protein
VRLDPFEPTLHPSDRAVARIAALSGGVYSAEIHRRVEPRVDAVLITANIRRLEALRRAGRVELVSNGVFELAEDHLDRALAHEGRLARLSPLSVKVESHLSLVRQVDALGPTPLDRVLAGEAGAIEGAGPLARRFDTALQQRRLFLIEQGWMASHETSLAPSALRRMAELERRTEVKMLAAELGMPVLPIEAGRVSGVYVRRIDLAQGPMALIVGDRHANLVPWRPALERFQGRQVEGLARSEGLSWSLVRKLGPGLPPM